MSNDICNAVCKAEPDYKREYYRLFEQVKKLENENARLRDTILGMCESLFAERG